MEFMQGREAFILTLALNSGLDTMLNAICSEPNRNIGRSPSIWWNKSAAGVQHEGVEGR